MASRNRPLDSLDATTLGTQGVKTVDEALAEELAAVARRRSRGFRRLLLFVGALVLIVLAAPQIVCRTPLLGRLVRWAAHDVRGGVTVGEASLNWFTAPHAKGVEVTDADGKSVARADLVTCDRTLWSLATAPTQLGRLRIERPMLSLVAQADGTTNIEQVLANFLQATTPSTAKGVDIAVEIVDGAAEVRDEITNRRWQMENLAGVVIVPADRTGGMSIDLQGAIAYADGPRPFTLRWGYRDAAEAGAAPIPQGDFSADIAALPLDMVAALARRFTPGIVYSGTVTGKLQSRFDWSTPEPTLSIDGGLSIVQPVVGGLLLRGDEMRLARIDLPVKATLVGKKLQIDQLGIGCDLASVEVRMAIDDFTRLTAVGTLPGLLAVLTHCDGRATARVNLAQIAQAMPHVMRLRDDVQVTGGEATLGIVSSRDSAGARQWQADAAISSLTATARSAAVTWDQPLKGVLNARDTPAGPVVERVVCQSDFLAVEGTNSPTAFNLSAQYSLDRLVERLSQFIDFGGIRLRGQGTAQAAWTREPADRFRVEGTAAVSSFELLAPGYPAWTEQQLVVGMRAVGRAAGLSIVSLEEATLGLESAGDQLTARLTAPVADFASPQAVLPLAVEGRGQLATWLVRLRPFAGLPTDLIGEGQLQLTAVGEVRGFDDVAVAQSKLTALPLRLAAYGLVIDEPSGELTFVGRYTPARTEVREAVLSSPGTQAAIRNLVYVPGDGHAPELNGELGLRADLAKLVTPTLLNAPTTAKPLQLGGIIEASSKLERTGAVTAVALDTILKDFTIVQGGTVAWREPQLRLVGSGVYEPRRDALAIDRLELVADALRVLLTGKLEQLSGARMIDCRGEATYDWGKLTPIVQTYLGNSIAAVGRDTQQFQLAGALVDPQRPGIAWHQLRGATRLGWQQMNLYGFALPQGIVDVELNQGIVRTSPLEVPVGGGRVRAAPALRVGPEPMELILDPGTLVDHVTITKEMANARLQYVMPILAGVAQVGGQFSVQLQDFRLPLDNPAAGSITGKMTVHNVDVEAGYLTQELAALVGRTGTASVTRESTVDFKMIEGRIYHQNLEFAFPQVTVRTMGSVGVVDQTLSLMAEVPIPSHLLANMPIAHAAVQGQVIRVPIAGTLSKPALDREAFRQATAQFLQGAAAGALQQALGGNPQTTAQDAILRGQNTAQEAVTRGTNAAQDALNRGTNAAQGVLNRGLNRLLGPGAMNPATGTGTR